MKNSLTHILHKDSSHAIGILIALGLIFFLTNPTQSLNQKHQFVPEHVQQDSVLHPRQFGKIRYRPFINLISEAQKENPFIQYDSTTFLKKSLKIFMEKQGNGSVSEFNSFFFNKSSNKEFPDMKLFIPFLQEELHMQMVSDDEHYGFELKVSHEGNESYILIPYQILTALLPQLEETSK